MAYWTEVVNAGNARNNIQILHLTTGSVGSGATLLISGTYAADYDKFSAMFYNGTDQPINYQVWASIYSGNDMGNVTVGSTWAELGNPVTVAAGSSSITSWETTNYKYLAVTGSTTGSQAYVVGGEAHLFMKMKH